MEIINPDTHSHHKKDFPVGPQERAPERSTGEELNEACIAAAEEKLALLIQTHRAEWEQLCDDRRSAGKKWSRNFYPNEIVFESLRQENPAIARYIEQHGGGKRKDLAYLFTG